MTVVRTRHNPACCIRFIGITWVRKRSLVKSTKPIRAAIPYVGAIELANARTIHRNFNYMIKKLLALTILGITTSVFAQSSTIIYGSIDAGLRNLTNTNSGADSRLTMSAVGTFSSNRLGIKGTEDLGGGWNTHYVIEMGFNSGTGTVDFGASNIEGRLFNRATIIGVTGPLGTIDFGHQYSIAFKTISFYEPFNYKYITIIPVADAAAGTPRPNSFANPFNSMGAGKLTNDVQYIGKFGGLLIGAEYALGENEGSSLDGSTQAIGAAFTDGRFSVGAAYTKQRPDVAPGAAQLYVDQRQWTLGGAYKVGALKISAGFLSTETKSPTELEAKNAWIGANYIINPVLSLTAGYYRTRLDIFGKQAGERQLGIVGAIYALSKRTALYAEVDRVKLSGVVAQFLAGGQAGQTGISAGIHHLF